SVMSTPGTHAAIIADGLAAERVGKVSDGKPNCADKVNEGAVAMVINTTHGKRSIKDSYAIRHAALVLNIPYFTTLRAAESAVEAIETARKQKFEVAPLQEYFPKTRD
ncbi:MAG: hypothetical protein OEZ04_01740, partial [Nitrospinota bacterium]|nr:hypothetical protein [Nitrospinota bacterium]